MQTKNKKKLFRILNTSVNTIDVQENEETKQIWFCRRRRFNNEFNEMQQIVSGSLDRKIKLWDTETCQCLKTFEGHEWTVSCLVCLSNRVHIASGSWDRTIKLWKMGTCECFCTYRGHTGYVKCLLEIDERRLASGSNDATIKIWKLPPNNIDETNEEQNENEACIQTLRGHTDCVRCLIFISHLGRLVSGSDDSTIRIWHLNEIDYCCLMTLRGHSNCVNSLVYNHDFNMLLSCSWDCTIKMWSLESSKCLRTLKSHSDWVTSLVLIPHLNEFISGAHDGTFFKFIMFNSQFLFGLKTRDEAS